MKMSFLSEKLGDLEPEIKESSRSAPRNQDDDEEKVSLCGEGRTKIEGISDEMRNRNDMDL